MTLKGPWQSPLWADGPLDVVITGGHHRGGGEAAPVATTLAALPQRHGRGAQSDPRPTTRHFPGGAEPVMLLDIPRRRRPARPWPVLSWANPGLFSSPASKRMPALRMLGGGLARRVVGQACAARAGLSYSIGAGPVASTGFDLCAIFLGHGHHAGRASPSSSSMPPGKVIATLKARRRNRRGCGSRPRPPPPDPGLLFRQSVQTNEITGREILNCRLGD